MRDNLMYQSTIIYGNQEKLCDFLNKLRKFEVTACYIVAQENFTYSFLVVYQYYRHISDKPDDLPVNGE